VVEVADGSHRFIKLYFCGFLNDTARFGRIDEWHLDFLEPFLRKRDRQFLAFRH